MSYDLEQAIADTLKTYKDCIQPIRLSDIDCYDDLIYRKSGCAALDWVIANHSVNGGLPRGRMIEIFSPEGVGKTTLACVMAASIQKYKDSNMALILDYEHKINLPYIISMGVQTERTLFQQPRGAKAGEAGMELATKAVSATDCGIIIIDSIPAIVSKEELEGELTDANIGALARLQSRTVKRMNESMNNGSPTVILINQLRDNIGGYGSNEKTSGARAIKFACAVRLDLRAREKIEIDGEKVGQTIRIKAVKNQCGRPFLEEEIDLYFGQGFDNLKWLEGKARELDVMKTAPRTKDRKKGVYINLPTGQERVDDSQLTEYLAKKKNYKLVYQCMIDQNTANLAAKAKDLKGLLSKGREDSSEESQLSNPDSSEEEQSF